MIKKRDTLNYFSRITMPKRSLYHLLLWTMMCLVVMAFAHPSSAVELRVENASGSPGEDAEEAELLRHFRDNTLSKTAEGQKLIKLYYQWSPVIVKAMENDEEFKEEVKDMIDEVLPLIRELAE
jgi:hypothetical protein